MSKSISCIHGKDEIIFHTIIIEVGKFQWVFTKVWFDNRWRRSYEVFSRRAGRRPMVAIATSTGKRYVAHWNSEGWASPISRGRPLVSGSVVVAHAHRPRPAWTCSSLELRGACSLHLPRWSLAAEPPLFSGWTDGWMGIHFCDCAGTP